MLDTREAATLVWLASVFTAALIRVPRLRHAVRGVLASLFSWQLLVPVLIVLGWQLAVVALAARLGLWQSALVGDTVVASLSVFALAFSMKRALREPRAARRTARDALAIAVFVEVFVNIRTFPFPVELVAQPVLFFLGASSALGERSPEYRRVKKFADGVITGLGLSVLAYAGWTLVTSWRDLTRADVLAFALPVWMVLGCLPVIYLAWLITGYSTAFSRADFRPSHERPTPWRIRLRSYVALVLAFHVRIRDVGAFIGIGTRRIQEARSLGQAIRVARAVRDEHRARQAEESAAAQRLIDFAGVAGTDAEGRQLDQREFEETRDALRWVARAHGSRYDPRRGFHRDLLGEVAPMFGPFGLPEIHGVTMSVSRDGRRWYAQRQTVTGWWFAIGASGPPPSEWTYDGPDPPRGFPGVDPAWGRGPREDPPNWRENDG